MKPINPINKILRDSYLEDFASGEPSSIKKEINPIIEETNNPIIEEINKLVDNLYWDFRKERSSEINFVTTTKLNNTNPVSIQLYEITKKDSNAFEGKYRINVQTTEKMLWYSGNFETKKEFRKTKLKFNNPREKFGYIKN